MLVSLANAQHFISLLNCTRVQQTMSESLAYYGWVGNVSLAVDIVICINRLDLEPPAIDKYVKMSHAFNHCAVSIWNDLPP